MPCRDRRARMLARCCSTYRSMIDFSLYSGCFRAAGRNATLAATILLVAAIGASAAEQGYSFDRTPGRLPKAVIPIHYAIELEPNLDDLRLAGSELIDIELREATDRLVLNAVDLTFDEASIDDAAESTRDRKSTRLNSSH